MIRLVTLWAVAILPWLVPTARLAGSRVQPASSSSLRWYKGNTHTHTLNSDGDSTPDEVVRWYREHGYQFLVLTDHNYLTDVDGLNALHGADEQFLVIKGEEVTDGFGGKSLHINGLDVNATVEPQGGSGVVNVVQRNVDAIRAVSGVPHINHPNFGWAMTADELRQISNNRLFELYNGHPRVNNHGGGGVPGLEAVWGHNLGERHARVRHSRRRRPHLQATVESGRGPARTSLGRGARGAVGGRRPARRAGAR